MGEEVFHSAYILNIGIEYAPLCSMSLDTNCIYLFGMREPPRKYSLSFAHHMVVSLSVIQA